MFGLFKKKDGEIKISEKIVIDVTAKFKAMLAYWLEHPDTVIICWFDDTLQQAETFFAAQTTEKIPLLTAREANPHHLTGQTAVFAEHHPLPGKEVELYKKLGLASVLIFSSLQEPLFRRFGSDRIIQLMKQLGMKEDEVIEHKMITSAIHTAQEKIARKVTFEQSASSQLEWIEKNLPAE